MKSDKQLIKERFEASFGRYNRLALVQQRICDLMVRRFMQMQPKRIDRAFEVGAGTGFLTSKIVSAFPDAEWYVNDLVPAAESFLVKHLDRVECDFMWGDAESMEFPQELDLIASASTVQWFDDLPKFVSESSKATKTDGWLLLSTFGKNNFREIRSTTGEGLEYYSVEEMVELFEEYGYEVVHSEEMTEMMNFDTPLDVLHHIRATGVNSIRKTRWGRGEFIKFGESYRSQFTAENGKVTLTYHPIILIGRKK